MKILRTIWLPLIVVVVVAGASFAVYRLHGVFGAESVAVAEIKDNTDPVIPKDVIYEISGPAGTQGEVNYLDERAQPHRQQFTTLPWSFTISTKLNSIFAQVVAQGDSDNLSCQITVNGIVRDRQTSYDHNAQISCLVKSA
ncbi:MAG: MmpS family transport accessory protein [Segniliparus sp.]|uniref:MmpS family transport accessory protein n=1 Tax=Segniliparus sp. TaxID=2804064 RepID=UPI003F3ABB8E